MEIYFSRKISPLEQCRFVQYNKNIIAINNFDKLLFKKLLKKLTNKYFKEYCRINEINNNDIENRVDLFFTKQKEFDIIKDTTSIVNVITFQTYIVKNYTKVLGVLTSDEINFVNSTEFPGEKIKDLNIKEYIDKLVSTNGIVETYKISDLSKICRHILNDYLFQNPKTVVTYGSFSIHKLNGDVEFSDIDVLNKNPPIFMVVLLIVMTIISGRSLSLLRVPYITNYILLKDDNEDHIMDCTYRFTKDFNEVSKISVNGISIIHPYVQLLSFFIMVSSQFKLQKFDESASEKYSKILKTIFSFLNISEDKKIIISEYSEDLKNKNIFSISKIMEKNNIRFLKIYFNNKKYVVILGNKDELLSFIVNKIIIKESLTRASWFCEIKDCVYITFGNDIFTLENGDIHIVSILALFCNLASVNEVSMCTEFSQYILHLLKKIEKIEDLSSNIKRLKIKGEHRFISLYKNIYNFNFFNP